MGRTANSNKNFHFDGVGFNNALQQALKKANIEIKNLLYAKVKSNVEGLTFKDNPVKLADGTVTSDSARKRALFDSIVQENLGWQERRLTKQLLELPAKMNSHNYSFTSEVRAMGSKGDYRDTHIGNYYEYGTGSKEDVSRLNAAGVSMGDDNPFRLPKSGQAVVSRPTSRWYDMGGNLRQSYGKGGVGRDNYKFSKYIGEDIQAHGWFKEAYMELRNDSGRVNGIYKKHISEVFKRYKNGEFLQYKERIILGKKRGR